ncbi:hypothetical protein H4582DRAFT_2058387 [Lactarius indigo]|nr:hypothetical protein H4582DRAFT_2058387 [Lactarius indigo]
MGPLMTYAHSCLMGPCGFTNDATTALWNELSIEDQEEYHESAREWSEKTPPKNIQSRMASSLHEQIIQDFQSQLYRTCRIHSIVLTAYEGEDNDLKIGLLEECPLAAIGSVWDEVLCQRDLSKSITTPIPLVFNADGCPELPKVVSHDGYKAKVVQTLLRDYCTAHIYEECIPYDFEWKDPSKIQIDEVFHLLDHWWDRQDQESPPLHGSQEETDPGNDGTPDSPGYKSSNINRSSSSDIAGPSDTHHVQKEMKELNTSPLLEKRK